MTATILFSVLFFAIAAVCIYLWLTRGNLLKSLEESEQKRIVIEAKLATLPSAAKILKPQKLSLVPSHSEVLDLRRELS